MLAKWTEVLPLFVVRWLAIRHSERVPYGHESGKPVTYFAIARPDVLIKVKND